MYLLSFFVFFILIQSPSIFENRSRQDEHFRKVPLEEAAAATSATSIVVMTIRVAAVTAAVVVVVVLKVAGTK